MITPTTMKRMTCVPMKWLIVLATTLALVAPVAHAADQRGDEYCVEVKNTSDGFLAVRNGPDVKTKLVAMLRHGYPLTVSPSNQYLEPGEQKLYPNWTKWVFVRGDFSGDTHPDSGHGYVYGKYIKKVPCKRSEPSTRLSHEPCFGVKVNSKRPAGWAASQALVSLEMCAE